LPPIGATSPVLTPNHDTGPHSEPSGGCVRQAGASADDSARALEEGLGLTKPGKDVPLAVEVVEDIKKPFVAIAGDAESALPRVKGFDTPEAAWAWAEGTDGASV